MEAHGLGAAGVYDRVKQELKVETKLSAYAQTGHSAIPQGRDGFGVRVFGGFIDKLPTGAAFNKILTFKMGQMHVHRYLKPLLEKIEQGALDLSFVITHELNLDDAPGAYRKLPQPRGRLRQGDAAPLMTGAAGKT